MTSAATMEPPAGGDGAMRAPRRPSAGSRQSAGIRTSRFRAFVPGRPRGVIIGSLPRIARALRRLDGAERGSATVRAAAYMLALVALLGLVLDAGALMQARHWAHAGADLGAVAAATVVAEGGTPSEACTAARAVAAANGATLTGCAVRGEDAEVRTVVVRRWWSAPVRAKGVAGPER